MVAVSVWEGVVIRKPCAGSVGLLDEEEELGELLEEAAGALLVGAADGTLDGTADLPPAGAEPEDAPAEALSDEGFAGPGTGFLELTVAFFEDATKASSI